MELVPKLAAMGLLGIRIPEEYGGSGMDTTSYALCVEEIARIDGSIALMVASQDVYKRQAVVSTDDAPAGPLGEAASPWAPEGAPADVEARTMAVAKGLAAAAVRRALDRRPTLRARVEHDGLPAVATTCLLYTSRCV